jgi:hypothetical protein
MDMETATSSTAKRAELQKQAKAELQAMRKSADPLTLTLATIHARDSEQFKKQTRADAPLRGIDQISLGRTTP